MKESPVLINSLDDEGDSLNRIEVKSNEQKSEDWLQNLIHKHPQILPANQFDDTYLPLIPIARELETNSGRVDNVYISPTGKITIVETKLWKNPEKHRTVVAQIIDYAKEISNWSYDEFNQAILKSSRNSTSIQNNSLDQIIEPHLSKVGLSLTEFQERTISCLQGGEFLLLIVGDKISANLALLSEAIQGVPGMDFRLGLVELQLYPLNKDSDWPLLIIPDVVGRTVEKTRGVIKIQYVQEKPSATIEITEEEATASKGKTTSNIFLQKTPDDLSPIYEQYLKVWNSKHIHIYWGTTGFSLRPCINEKLQTILEAYPEWAISLVRQQDADNLGVSQEDYTSYFESISPVQEAVNLLSSGKKFLKHEVLTSEDLNIILEATTMLVEKMQNSKKTTS